MKKIVITAGGTSEKIDNVRKITNSSSGKTGIELANWAYKLGYDVVALSSVEFKAPYKIIFVESLNFFYCQQILSCFP